jgi:aryl-alcohol dehydrogenase-like predicted oxidoreductase
MEERLLGKTGFRVSAIGFGAWGIGGALWQGGDDSRSGAALRAALEGGCNFIDTALAYGDGHSERLIARTLRDWKRRVTVATKVPPKNQVWPALKGVPLRAVFPVDYVKRSAEQSAANLERPVDLLQLHVWRDEWLKDPLWPAVARTIEDLITAGTVKSFGISINDHDPASALEAVRTCDLVSSVQVIYNIFDPTPARELFPLCRERKVGVIARVPLDEGGLTGTITAESSFADGDFRARYFAGDRPAQVAEHAEALRPLLMEEAGSMVEGALRFVLSHPVVSSVIPGMRTAEHARANCAVGDGRPLTPGLLKRLEAHAWARNFYPVPKAPRRVAWSGVLGALLLALWVVLGFVIPVGAGWVHLLFAAGILLVIRAVVAASDG